MADKTGTATEEEAPHARSQSLVGARGSTFQSGPAQAPFRRKKRKKKWDIMETVCPTVSSILIFLSCTSTILAIVGPWFYVHIAPEIACPILIAIGFTTLMTVVNFLYASCMNPGYLPKTTDMRYIGLQPAFVNIKGTRTQLKMCRTCHYYRMPRTVHCSQCDYCVECFDHHCPWVNNCIGRRNYRNFFAFVATLTVHIWLCVGISVTFLVFRRNETWDSSLVTIAVVASIAGLIALPVTGLLCFHLFLIYKGVTTYEHVSDKYIDGKNPFDMGPCKNCVFELCGPEFPEFEPINPPMPNEQEGDASTAEFVQRDLIAKFAQQAAPRKKVPTEPGASTIVVEIPAENDPTKVKVEIAPVKDEQNNNTGFLPLTSNPTTEQLTVKCSSCNIPLDKNDLGLGLGNDAGGDVTRLEDATSSVVVVVEVEVEKSQLKSNED